MCHITTTCVLVFIVVCCNCRRYVRDRGDVKVWEPYQRPFRRKPTNSLSFLPNSAAHRFYFNTRNKRDYLKGDSSRDQLHRYWRQRHHSFGRVSSKVNTSPISLRRYWRQRHQPFTLRTRAKYDDTKSREGKLKRINTTMKRKNHIMPISAKETFACPLRADGSKGQTCSSDRRICLNEKNICDNQRDCPGGEDEEPAFCLKNWILRWMAMLRMMMFN